MKRLLAILLCVTLVTSIAVVGGSADTSANDAAVDVVMDITALSVISRDSKAALEKANKSINDFCYNHGYYNLNLITNYDNFEAAIAQYNDLVDYLEGDINADQKVDAKDALEVLKASVGKATLTQKQGYAADVTNDTKFDAKDALMILQFSVQKRTEFPSQEIDHSSYTKEDYVLKTAKGDALYKATYQSMIDRIQSNGFTNTSLTGAYEGMYMRDASIQILAHVNQGDFNQARAILNYITDYHEAQNLDYVMYIKRTYDAKHKQTDTTFFFLRSWVQFAMNAPKTAENKAYIEKSTNIVKKFANYYLDNGYLRSDYDLLYNESFEHSREGSYFQTYDLVTNVYASQALHELSEYFKTSDAANAKKWSDAADRIAKGIHKNLVVKCKDNLMYAEMYGTKKANIETVPESEKTFYAGLSWVNLAPMGCDWYAADPDILEHTYQIYLTYGSVTYRNRDIGKRYEKMLEVYTPSALNVTNPRRITSGNHIIGKGLAWEMMYCKKMGYTDRLELLLSFIEEAGNTFYPEVWAFAGGVNDTGNQEQASWLLIANKTVQPDIGK